MRCRRYRIRMWFALAPLLMVPPADAITLQVDYTYDTGNFFGAGNPQGATAGTQAKAALEAAASYFSSILDDSFSAIQTPAPLYSSVSDGVVTWNWEERFSNPTTDTEVHLSNPIVPANQYVIYAGARGLSDNEAGRGGPGGYWYEPYSLTGSSSFTSDEVNQVSTTTASFIDAITTRGQTSGFARWGGSITFDTSARTWSFDHTVAPASSTTDFYSVAIHELAHALGFGESGITSDWNSFVSGSTFTGTNAMSQNGSAPVPLSADLAHWVAGKQSVIYGTSTPQEAAMDADILEGTRKGFTALDAAALKDIGWDVLAPPGANGDYNNNGVVDAADYVLWREKLNQNVTLPNDTSPGNVGPADYTVWRNNFGASAGSGTLLVGAAVPEPASLASVLIGGLVVLAWRRRVE